jgi:hypothetical protein
MTPLLILWLNKYPDLMPVLSQKVDTLINQMQNGATAYSLTQLQAAISASTNRATNSPLSEDGNKIELYQGYMNAVNNMTLDSFVSKIEKTEFGDDNIPANDRNMAAHHVVLNTRSQAETALLSVSGPNKLNDIIDLLKDAMNNYDQLGRSQHNKDFKKLISEVIRVSVDNKGDKEARAYAAIEKAYLKEQEPLVSFGKIFGHNKSHDNGDKFAYKVNHHPEKFHYPRMLAAIMQNDVFQVQHQGKTQSTRAKSHESVWPGTQPAYDTLAPLTLSPSLTGPAISINMALNSMGLDFSRETSKDAHLKICARDIHNAQKYPDYPLLKSSHINRISEIIIASLENDKNLPEFIKHSGIIRQIVKDVAAQLKSGPGNIDIKGICYDQINKLDSSDPLDIVQTIQTLNDSNGILTKLSEKLTSIEPHLTTIIEEENKARPSKPAQEQRQDERFMQSH